MAQVQISSSSIVPGAVEGAMVYSSGWKNRLINGDMSIWQRGTSSTSPGYQTADRWYVSADNGLYFSQSQQSFTVGQTEVPGEPKYFLRFSTTNAANTGAHVRQRIEGVRTFAGQTCTLSFYAKSSTAFTPAYIRLNQGFGTGGSAILGNDPTVSISQVTASWQKFTYTFNVASISGKTIGTDDYLEVIFRIPDSVVTNFDICFVQLEKGPVATPYEYVEYGEQLRRCQRYYWKLDMTEGSFWFYTIDLTNIYRRKDIQFPVNMRAKPNCLITAATSGTFASTYPNVPYATTSWAQCEGNLTGAGYAWITTFSASAEL